MPRAAHLGEARTPAGQTGSSRQDTRYESVTGLRATARPSFRGEGGLANSGELLLGLCDPRVENTREVRTGRRFDRVTSIPQTNAEIPPSRRPRGGPVATGGRLFTRLGWGVVRPGRRGVTKDLVTGPIAYPPSVFPARRSGPVVGLRLPCPAFARRSGCCSPRAPRRRRPRRGGPTWPCRSGGSTSIRWTPVRRARHRAGIPSTGMARPGGGR